MGSPRAPRRRAIEIAAQRTAGRIHGVVRSTSSSPDELAAGVITLRGRRPISSRRRSARQEHAGRSPHRRGGRHDDAAVQSRGRLRGACHDTGCTDRSGRDRPLLEPHCRPDHLLAVAAAASPPLPEDAPGPGVHSELPPDVPRLRRDGGLNCGSRLAFFLMREPAHGRAAPGRPPEAPWVGGQVAALSGHPWWGGDERRPPRPRLLLTAVDDGPGCPELRHLGAADWRAAVLICARPTVRKR